jgi:hypothetical protein
MSESVGGGRGMSDRMTTTARRRLVRNTRRVAGADLHEITERRPGLVQLLVEIPSLIDREPLIGLEDHRDLVRQIVH